MLEPLRVWSDNGFSVLESQNTPQLPGTTTAWCLLALKAVFFALSISTLHNWVVSLAALDLGCHNRISLTFV